jgi:hypothetical protein
MVGFLKRLFGRGAAVPPLLVRLRTSTGFVEGPVELSATWLPSGQTSTWTTQAAQGLCIVPWRGGHRVNLVLAHSSRRARLAVSHEDAFGGAQEVWLTNDEAIA